MFEKIADKYIKEAIELSDYLTDNPEIGSEEYKSSKKHVELLRKYGIEVEYPYLDMPTAFHGVFNKGQIPRFGILVEYDALKGMGHACGHSASGALSTLAALILNDVKDKIPAEINIYGTPDEEITGGKIDMANKGAFNDLDTVIMIHMSDKSSIYSPILALDAMEFEFFGTPAHASASPWEGNNSLNAMRLAFDAMDMMRQHVKDDVRMHAYIIKGGDASNIVPDYTKGEFCVRAKDVETLQYIYDWVIDIGEAAAKMTKTEFKSTRLGHRFYELSSKITGENLLTKIFEKRGHELEENRNKIGGSSDIGNVDYICPAFHPSISIGTSYKTHTQEFEKVMKNENVHKAIKEGGIIIAEFLNTLANNPDILAKIKEEHKKNRS